MKFLRASILFLAPQSRILRMKFQVILKELKPLVVLLVAMHCILL